jgi:chlorosome envelope protein B
MANETPSDFSGAINSLMESIGKIGQAQLELVNNGLKSVGPALEPLANTATEAFGNLAKAFTQALQSVSDSIGPKK